MNRLAVVGVAALFLSIVPQVAAQDSETFDIVRAYWGDPDGLQEAAPGDHAVKLTVTLQNTAVITWSGVHATLRATDDITPRPGSDVAALDGTLSEGDIWEASFLVDVSDDVDLDDALDIDLRVRSAHGERDPQTFGIDGQVKLTGHANPTVRAFLTSVPMDEETNVPVEVRNEGDGPMGVSTLTLTSTTSLAVVGRSNTWRIPSLDAGEAYTVEVPLVASESTRNTAATDDDDDDEEATDVQILRGSLAYSDAAGAIVSGTYDLGFRIGGARASTEVRGTLDTPVLTAGRTNDVSFTITNRGDETLQDVSASLGLPTGTTPPFTALNASGSADLGDIAPGKSATYRATVIVSSQAADTYALELSLAWTDAAGVRQLESADYGVLVTGNIDIRLTGASAAVGQDGSVSVTGTLTNVGNTQANNVYYRVMTGGNSTTPAYLGDLAPNSPLPFTTSSRATGVGTGTLPSGGQAGRFPGGPPGSGGGQGAPPGSFPGANGTRANFTRAGAGAPVTLVVTWNDEFGNDRSATFPVPAGPGGAAAATGGVRTQRAAPAEEDESFLPAAGVGALVVVAGVSAVVFVRRRR